MSTSSSSSSSSQKSYDLSRFDLDREMQRLRTQALRTWPQEARLLQWYGLRNGMSVLELGSGPGFITEQLLALLPGGQVTTVENSPEMLARAAAYLEGKAGERLHAVNGDIMATGLPDNSFDFAIARFLYQHLADPVAAARESLRVLKPGGRLVLVDVDDTVWGLVDPPRPDLKYLEDIFVEDQAARGGNRLVGRRFPRILAAAGYQQIAFDAVTWHSDLLGESARAVLTEDMTQDNLGEYVKTGRITQEQADAAAAADRAWLAGPDPLLLYFLLVGSGQKP